MYLFSSLVRATRQKVTDSLTVLVYIILPCICLSTPSLLSVQQFIKSATKYTGVFMVNINNELDILNRRVDFLSADGISSDLSQRAAEFNVMPRRIHRIFLRKTAVSNYQSQKTYIHSWQIF